MARSGVFKNTRINQGRWFILTKTLIQYVSILKLHNTIQPSALIQQPAYVLVAFQMIPVKKNHQRPFSTIETTWIIR